MPFSKSGASAPKRPASAQSNRATGTGAPKSIPNTNATAGAQAIPKILVSGIPTSTSSAKATTGNDTLANSLPRQYIDANTPSSKRARTSTASPAPTSNGLNQITANHSVHNHMPSASTATETLIAPPTKFSADSTPFNAAMPANIGDYPLTHNQKTHLQREFATIRTQNSTLNHEVFDLDKEMKVLKGLVESKNKDLKAQLSVMSKVESIVTKLHALKSTQSSSIKSFQDDLLKSLELPNEQSLEVDLGLGK